MKQFRLYTLALLVLSALSTTAKADDFAFTINWDTPGAVKISKGTGSSPAFDIPADATSWTGTESLDTYYIKPAGGYIITAVHEKLIRDGKPVETDLRINGNERYGQFVSKFIGSAHKDAVYTVATKKLAPAGEITLDVQNGPDKISAWFKNARNGADGEFLSTFRMPEIIKGEHKVAITENENYLNIYPNGSTVIYSVKLNGEAQKVSYGGFEIPVKDGDKIELRVFENDPAQCKLSLKFTSGVNCLESIYNRATGKFIYAADIDAAKGEFSFEEGDNLRLIYNEDYNVTGISVNGVAQQPEPDTTGFNLIMEKDTEIEITAVAKVYEDIPYTIYIKNPEGIVIRKGPFAEDEVIPLGECQELEEDIVIKTKSGMMTIKKGEVKKYTLTVPGKSKKFFWDAVNGYWVKKSWLITSLDAVCEPPSPGVDADGSSLYLETAEITTDNKLVIFFDGAEKEAKILAKNIMIAGYLPFENLPADLYVPVGYTLSSYDPDYHETITTGKVGLPKDKFFQVFLDNMEIKQGKDGDGIFSFNFTANPSILKIFSRDAKVIGDNWEVTDEVKKPVITFEAEEGCSADVTYDMLFKHTDLSEPLKVIGKTLISIKPAAGTHVIGANGEVKPNEDGICEYWVGDNNKETVKLSKTSGVDEIGIAEESETVIHNLQGIEVKGSLEQLPAGIYIVNGKKIIK